MPIQYGYKWFRGKCRLTEVWDEARARSAHDERLLYAAVRVEESGQPQAFIEFNGSYVGVGFLDDRGREWLSYTFNEVAPGRLFLSRAIYREFVGESEQLLSGEIHDFAQDGAARIERDERALGRRSAEEGDVDVSINWEDYPAFGEYQGVWRERR